MQLRVARLCLDCEEVHDGQRCPACASESFAFLGRWIPAPERRGKPRPPVSDPSLDHERLDAVRRLTSTAGRVLTGGIVGLTALSVLGWLSRRDPDAPAPGESPASPASADIHRRHS